MTKTSESRDKKTKLKSNKFAASRGVILNITGRTRNKKCKDVALIINNKSFDKNF